MSTLEAVDLKTQVADIAEKGRMAALDLATLSTEAKNKALGRVADLIEGRAPELLVANEKDLAAGREAGLSGPLLERLTFTEARIQKMAQGVREVIALPDPVGEEIEKISRPNGLDIRKVRVPIGVVGIIYESRPNVTVDCAVLCLKSGNAAVLRGGKEAFHTNTALAALIQEALEPTEVPVEAVQLVPTTDRAALNHLLRLDEYIDCIIPRGGEALIRFVAENALMPVIKHYKGVCNYYVDTEADVDLAIQLVVNAKTQRPSVCNAIENLVVHRGAVRSHLFPIAQALAEKGVELRVEDDDIREDLRATGVETKPTGEHDFDEEYLDLILAVKVVSTLDAAVAFVNQFGSSHSDGIVTANPEAAERFLNGVDSATVYWNASTRFTDGYEFGLGAEIGISTDKLHARGPMGLRELCTYKYKIYGSGQIKE